MAHLFICDTVWHGSFICVVPWNTPHMNKCIHMCDMAHISGSRHTHIWISPVATHMKEPCPMYSYAWLIHTGWLRLVDSLNWEVSFAKERYKRDYILQKRPIILRSLLPIATPYLRFEPPPLFMRVTYPCVWHTRKSVKWLIDSVRHVTQICELCHKYE